MLKNKVSWGDYKIAVSDDKTVDFNDGSIKKQFEKLSKNTMKFIKEHKLYKVINKSNVNGIEKGRNYYRFTLKDKIIEINIDGKKIFFHPQQNIISIPVI